MKMSCYYCYSLLLFLTSIQQEIPPAELISLKEKVNRAIIKFEETERKLWPYQRSRYEDENVDISIV
jgi:hypothetical protein